jgi:hypothetical protein
MSATATAPDTKAEFAEFFGEGWAVGATDPERFFAHFGGRMAPDVRMVQPLTRDMHGPGALRELFGPLFEALPDLVGRIVRWGPTDTGVIVELELRSASTGIAWTTLDVIDLRDGKIAQRHAHFDPLPLLFQMLRRPRVAVKLLPTLIKR